MLSPSGGVRRSRPAARPRGARPPPTRGATRPAPTAETRPVNIAVDPTPTGRGRPRRQADVAPDPHGLQVREARSRRGRTPLPRPRAGRARRRRHEDLRRDVGRHAVHEPRGEERRGRHAAALDEERPHLERVERRRGAPRGRRRPPEPASRRPERRAPGTARGAGRRSGTAVTSQTSPPAAEKTRAVADTRSAPSRTRRRCGMIAVDRARRRVRSGSSARTVPAPTRIASRSSRRQERVAPRGLARNPLRFARPRRGLPVEGRRPLQVDERPSLARRT